MSDKAPEQLDRSDRTLRRLSPVGMDDGVKQIILRYSGFELFNTRKYHNYETWSDGYRVIGRRDRRAMTTDEVTSLITEMCGRYPKDGAWRVAYVVADAEDLDTACARFADALSPPNVPETH